MVKSIPHIYEEVKKKYKLRKLFLASGGLVDVKGVGKSDVDIVYITDDYNNLDYLFSGAKKEERPDKNRCYYTFKCGGREVSICASNDESVMRSVKHRANEIMLNKFPLITACAANYKLNGEKTEPAWAKTLALQGDPYEELMMNTTKLKNIAKKREKELERILKASRDNS